jgi:nicotinate-nucleotide--dimethylbenzimidazole phosphoribosyltransferase
MARPLIDLDALADLAAQVGSPDHEAAAALARSAGGLAGQPALGRLREVAGWLAGAQGGPLRPLRRVVLISACTPSPTGLSAIAEASGVLLRRIDPTAGDSALAAGVSTADDEVDRGTDLAVLAGTSAGLAPTVAISVLTAAEPVQVLARGAAACAPEQWMRRATEVRDTRRRVSALRDQPAELLAGLGCPALAEATGFVLRAIARRTPLLLDGLLALAAALVAQRVAPRVTDWVQVADAGPEPAHRLAAAALGRRPLLTLGVGRNDGLAGLLAVPMLRAAIALADEEQPE